MVEGIRDVPTQRYRWVGDHKGSRCGGTPLPETKDADVTLVIDARGYSSEGDESLERAIVTWYRRGFRQFIVANTRGQRFIGCGLGPESGGLRIDVYGSPGDYLASGIDGAEVIVHGSAQDQLAQIMKGGKLVVYGDVGQTFMYAAKGGEAFILGNAAGRPLINAVGRPRVVINGTCLDYLAESFMAGDQLNGGEFASLTARDWTLIRPYLEKNESIFGIPLERLLTVDGTLQSPAQVYRKIRPAGHKALMPEEAWVTREA